MTGQDGDTVLVKEVFARALSEIFYACGGFDVILPAESRKVR